MSLTTTYTVTGMSCEHCVRAVETEVAGVDGVESVAVDLQTGLVSIESDGPLDHEAVAAAVDEAGYEVAR